MTPTIDREIVQKLYIFNNTNNIYIFLFTSHLFINAVFWEIRSTFVPIYNTIPQPHHKLANEILIFYEKITLIMIKI